VKLAPFGVTTLNFDISVSLSDLIFSVLDLAAFSIPAKVPRGFFLHSCRAG
jgi:hypothetical protein